MPTDEVKLLDLTLPTAAENLACDEVLLDWCDEQGGEVLRFWEPAAPFVVVGYANRVAVEVNQAACLEAGVGVYRRCTGGGTVLQAPGCLNYALVLLIERTAALASVSGANQSIMERHRAAVQVILGGNAIPEAGPPVGGTLVPRPRRVEVCGHTDLALDGRKFSGNAQRRKRRALLFHGTFLHGLDLALPGRFLNMPSRQPDYRQRRGHGDFLINLPLSPSRLKARLIETWQADAPLGEWPRERVQRLALERYETVQWNQKF
jgi:lipoate---protein ligase